MRLAGQFAKVLGYYLSDTNLGQKPFIITEDLFSENFGCMKKVLFNKMLLDQKQLDFHKVIEQAILEFSLSEEQVVKSLMRIIYENRKENWADINEDTESHKYIKKLYEDFKHMSEPPMIEIRMREPLLKLPSYVKTEEQKQTILLMDKAFRKNKLKGIEDIPTEGEFKCSLGYAYGLYSTYEARILDCIFNPKEVCFEELRRHTDAIADEFIPFCKGGFPKVGVIDKERHQNLSVIFPDEDAASLASFINFNVTLVLDNNRKTVLRFIGRLKPSSKTSSKSYKN